MRKRLLGKFPKPFQLFAERLYFARYLKLEVEIARRFCDRRLISVDIGANKGDVTLFLSRFSRHVVAFEPVPELFIPLRERFHKCNVTIHNCALGSSSGRFFLSVPIVRQTCVYTRSSLVKQFQNESILGEEISGIKRIEVSVRLLDDFGLDQVGFIKIDVEGYELEVLKGAYRTIAASRPVLFIEIEQRHHDVDISDVFSEICKLDYTGYFILDGCFKRLSEFRCETMQNPENEKTFTYINNFIFLPEKSGVANTPRVVAANDDRH